MQGEDFLQHTHSSAFQGLGKKMLLSRLIKLKNLGGQV